MCVCVCVSLFQVGFIVSMCAFLLCIWGPVYVLTVFLYSTVKENTTEIKIDEQWIARVQDSIFRDFWNGSLFHFLSLACYYFIHWQCTHNNKTGGNNENEWPKIHMIWFWICDGYVVVVVVFFCFFSALYIAHPRKILDQKSAGFLLCFVWIQIINARNFMNSS